MPQKMPAMNDNIVVRKFWGRNIYLGDAETNQTLCPRNSELRNSETN
jgi:hypothetical protein